HGMTGVGINKIYKDREGLIWLTFDNGVLRFNGNRFTPFYYSSDSKVAVKSGEYTNVYEDSKNRLWFTGFEGGACFIDKAKDDIQIFKPILGDSTSISNNHTSGIFEDDEGVLWICGSDYVMHKYNEEEGNFQRYPL
ncbi:MAG: two-component regulator propeller domain-containing protein, partial [Bacteroidota bacterium]